jgi:hypothetical protein
MFRRIVNIFIITSLFLAIGFCCDDSQCHASERPSEELGQCCDGTASESGSSCPESSSDSCCNSLSDIDLLLKDSSLRSKFTFSPLAFSDRYFFSDTFAASVFVDSLMPSRLSLTPTITLACIRATVLRI